MALNDRGKSVKGSAIMLLGVAYKKDVDDTRESPAFRIGALLGAHGALLSYHDPFVQVFAIEPERQPRPAALSPEELARHDAVVVITDHSAVDYASVLEHAKLIVDAHGVYRGSHAHVVRA